MNVVRLTPEQVREVFPGSRWEVFACLDDTGQCIVVKAWDLNKRGLLCDACTGTCAESVITWTREDQRGKGYFSALREYAMGVLGIDKEYATRYGDADAEIQYWKFNFARSPEAKDARTSPPTDADAILARVTAALAVP